jgi:thymidine kinase
VYNSYKRFEQINTQKFFYIKERIAMVNLITGPKGSGKTQQIIELANEKVKTSNGNVVLIKKSHRDTYSVDFNVRAICMDDYKDIETLEELVGFLYGMVAGNHDIDTIFIDGALKQADITLNSLPDFLQKLDKISATNNIEFFVSVSASKEDIPNIDDPAYKVLC